MESPKRKPTAKKTFSLEDFKKKIGNENEKEKPLVWYKMSPYFKKATGLDGFPRGYVGLSRGFSNTGKSTTICELAVAAQKQGALPVLIDTENNLGRNRLALMGFDWEGAYIKIDNDWLLQEFGLKRSKDAKEAAIEDLASALHYFLDLQKNGELPYDLVFLIDSIGTLDCVQVIKSLEKDSTTNNQWNAGAYEREFKSILNYRIPSSRKETSDYTNTLVAVQKIWIDAQGAGVVKHKGGEAFHHASRLIIHHGGIKSPGTKKVVATSKKRDMSYGVETNVVVAKNHIDGPTGGIALEGKLISTPHGFIGAEKGDIDLYKKEHVTFFRDIFGIDDLEPEMITTKYTDIQMDSDDFNKDMGRLLGDIKDSKLNDSE